MKKLSEEGLFVRTLLTPIIPFITDDEDNIKDVIRLSAENVFKQECKKYGLLYEMNDIIKAYKTNSDNHKQLSFI